MDERTLRALEFDKVLQLLSAYCTCSLGRELANRLRPISDLQLLSEWQQETTEAVNLLEICGSVPLGGLHDIRSLLQRARAGGMLLPEQLQQVADTLRAMRLLRDFLLKHEMQAMASFEEEQFSLLADRAQGIGVFLELERQIERCIVPEGEVADAASPALARLRQQLRNRQARVRETLDSIVNSSTNEKFVQERLVTLRSGRYVVPVKQEYRSFFPGIVHDRSASGATLFIEPMAVVELNNEIRQLEAEELQEIERILMALTQAVAGEAVDIHRGVDIAAEMDFIFAKGRLALEWRCVEPRMTDTGWISILGGRHPLLTGEVVPIDLWLGRESLALVITGPNTGGKTVTLKTVGLFALMAQAGLHIPAQPGSELCVFDAVYADIGDEQSIEQSLSTFSSHMGHIIRILGRATDKSLVLLDELGAGTDPTEGAALAMSILEFLMDLGCRTVATTHYSELKSFAYTEPRAENASVEFDVETLQPTFRLSIGVAGSSNAFAIARRLGLPEAIVQRAKARLTHEEIKVEELIRTVEENRRQTVRDRGEAARLRLEMQNLRDRYEEAFGKLQERRSEIIATARREAEELVSQARQEIEQLIGELRRSQQTELEEKAQEARRRVVDRQTELRQALAPPEPKVRVKAPSGPLHRGDTVRILSLGQKGEVVTEPDGDGQVLVQVGMVRLVVAATELEKLDEELKPEVRRSNLSGVTRAKSSQITTELDLRGLTVEEALGRVDKYLDDCMLASLPRVCIIHGKGTGALRQAVRDRLKGLPQVKDYRGGEAGEGGSGVTIVEF